MKTRTFVHPFLTIVAVGLRQRRSAGSPHVDVDPTGTRAGWKAVTKGPSSGVTAWASLSVDRSTAPTGVAGFEDLARRLCGRVRRRLGLRAPIGKQPRLRLSGPRQAACRPVKLAARLANFRRSWQFRLDAK